MKKTRLGGFVCKGVPVFIEEKPVDTLQLSPEDPLRVELAIRDTSLDMDLADLRSLKRLVNVAEARLMLRHEQAQKARNFTLDL